MSEKHLRSVVGNLRRVISFSQVGGIPDAQLVERYLQRRDELALEMLVWRHGSMVLNVCRRVLRDTHEAEDAFQATFLIFVRKMQAIRKSEVIGSWLYKVAYRVAIRAKARSVCRQTENHADLDHLPGNAALDDPAQRAAWRDLRPVLDEELNRLPEQYRTPFVLYYLEGMGYPEVAEQLGCPRGTVSSRLTRARGLLRNQLLRRGIGLSSTLLGAALAQQGAQAASAAMTISLANSTMQTILLIASGKTAGAGSASAQAIALAEGVIKVMTMSRASFVAVIGLALGVLGFGSSMAVKQAMYAAQASPAASSQHLPAADGALPRGTSPGSPVLSKTEPSSLKQPPSPQNELEPQISYKLFLEWLKQNPNQKTPASAISGADRFARIEERLARLEEQVAQLSRNRSGASGQTSGDSTSAGSGRSSSTSGAASGSAMTGTVSNGTQGVATVDKPLTIASNRFNFFIKIDDEEAARINKVVLYMSGDHGRKWETADAFTPEREAGGFEASHLCRIHVHDDGEYWFKMHVHYALGRAPGPEFTINTTPDLKVVVCTKEPKSANNAVPAKIPSMYLRAGPDTSDAQLADLTAQLKVLQAKIAALKAKQGR